MEMTWIFIIVVILLIVWQHHREKNWVNLISILMAPYVILVALNNLLVKKVGFYMIEDNVLVMLLAAFLLFFVGGLPFNAGKFNHNSEADNEKKLAMYDIDAMNAALYIIGIMGLIKMVVLFLRGAFNSSNIDLAEGTMGNGIVGHLLLASYSIVPIVFLYWTYTKKLKYLISIMMIFVVTFSSLVKYNIVGVFVTTFIFILMYRKSLLKRSIVVLVAAVVAVFIGNYALTFFIKGAYSEISYTFYLGHLWTYMSGSLIYDNYIFSKGVGVGLTVGYKLMTFLCALPNMFLNKFMGITLFPHTRKNDLFTSSFGETSNVTDAIGYLFPSKGDIYEIVLWAFVICALGFLFALIYRKNTRRSNKFNTFIANFLCYFVFFSFFGTFYINSSPWEILVYSLFVPNLFFERRIRIGRKVRLKWRK